MFKLSIIANRIKFIWVNLTLKKKCTIGFFTVLIFCLLFWNTDKNSVRNKANEEVIILNLPQQDTNTINNTDEEKLSSKIREKIVPLDGINVPNKKN